MGNRERCSRRGQRPLHHFTPGAGLTTYRKVELSFLTSKDFNRENAEFAEVNDVLSVLSDLPVQVS